MPACIALTSFVHGRLSVSEGRLYELDERTARDLELAGLIRVRFAPPVNKAVTGNVAGRWAGATVVCIASGPSLTAGDVEHVKAWRHDDKGGRRRVIVVNTSFRVAPWADSLYAGDARWWKVYGAEVERAFLGELWGSAQIEIANCVEVIDAPGLSTRPGRIHYGANSGFQAVNLAFLWGAARIVLVAFDMTHGPHGETHYFGRHAGGLPNPPRDLSGWVQLIAQLGIDLRAQGVEVVNSSRRTAITCFERMPIEEALLVAVPDPG